MGACGATCIALQSQHRSVAYREGAYQEGAYRKKVRLDQNLQLGRYNNAGFALLEHNTVQEQRMEDRAPRVLSEAVCTKTVACASGEDLLHRAEKTCCTELFSKMFDSYLYKR